MTQLRKLYDNKTYTKSDIKRERGGTVDIGNLVERQAMAIIIIIERDT